MSPVVRSQLSIVLAAGVIFACVTAGCVDGNQAGRNDRAGAGGDVAGSGAAWRGRGAYAGRVTDQGGRPVAKARVDVNGKEVLTKADGSFSVAVGASKRYILNISHRDFADLSYVSRTPGTGQSWRLVRAQVSVVDAKKPVLLKDDRPELAKRKIGGARFTLPPGALVDPRGNAPAGPVRAAIATLDVANGEGPVDWAVRSDDGQQDGYLVSYGAVFIQFTDASGKVKYQLRPGTAGQLSLPVIPSMSKHAPDTPQARFWYYDKKDAYWKLSGEAGFDKDAGSYVGKVTHLSTINTDIAKFNNAACLKITLDPTVATGLKLRIRYHSGGTPFGQAPVLVMNDPENAAYRLPANTNVLLELLDASDEAFGDAIVEDPPGTPLVNTVVNTGSPIPTGHSLWPPPPYADCKPIRLRRGLPEVEIRINELVADTWPKDNPTDDYVTWAPTFCRARLTTPMASNVTVVLTNDAPGSIPGGGDVVFAPDQSPWPANTTATATDVTLSLPGNGAWVPFVIAGKYQSPSENDKDTIIEAHMNTAAGAVLGTKALMVRVRKNANGLRQAERDRFLFALQRFRNQSGTNYVRFQEMHRLAATAGDEAHHGPNPSQPAFLSWHRAMLLDVERELQKIDPSVALHYWNWDAAAPNVFSADFMGAPGNNPAGSIALPNFSPTNPLFGWNTDLPFSGGELRRDESNHGATPSFARPLDHPVDPKLVDSANYGPTSSSASFSYACERNSHDGAHGWSCTGGNILFPQRSSSDPLFYLLHSQIEREWAYWQRARNRFGDWSTGSQVFRVPEDYDNTGNWNDPGVASLQRGSFLNDGIWPWDGTSGAGGAGARDDRPVSQAPPQPPPPAGDENVPNSRPVIPNTAFPASVRRNLWPAGATVPTNAHMIDYLGKFLPQNGLGFCYDDVPYN